MGERIVKILTCDRCGKEKIVERIDREKDDDVCNHPHMLIFEDWGRWGRSIVAGGVAAVLCDECLEEQEKLMKAWWNSGVR